MAVSGAGAFLLTVQTGQHTARHACYNSATDQPVRHPGRDGHFFQEATGSGPLSYQWRFLEWKRHTGSERIQVGAKKVTIDQVGDYSVAVSNAAGSISSQTASLKHRMPPIISIQPKSQTIGMGAPLSLDISAIERAPLFINGD